jgi:hypothetical protein
MISLTDLSVLIEELKARPDDQVTSVYEIRRMLGRQQLPDVDLTLGLLDGALVIYWRETYKHSSYSLGLFKFSNGKLIQLCEGSGGVDASH